MNDQQRIARAHNAAAAWDKFVGPEIEAMIAEYTARIVEVANTELNPDKRRDKITALSNAIRIAKNIEAGLHAAITDGDVAKRELLRKDKIEGMTKPARRLLGIAPF